MVAADFLDGNLDLFENLVLGGFVAGGGRNGLEFLVDLEETGQWRIVLDDDLVHEPEQVPIAKCEVRRSEV